MLIGAHVPSAHPLAEAAARDADLVPVSYTHLTLPTN